MSWSFPSTFKGDHLEHDSLDNASLITLQKARADLAYNTFLETISPCPLCKGPLTSPLTHVLWFCQSQEAKSYRSRVDFEVDAASTDMRQLWDLTSTPQRSQICLGVTNDSNLAPRLTVGLLVEATIDLLKTSTVYD